jgi:hypothetical protein
LKKPKEEKLKMWGAFVYEKAVCKLEKVITNHQKDCILDQLKKELADLIQSHGQSKGTIGITEISNQAKNAALKSNENDNNTKSLLD